MQRIGGAIEHRGSRVPSMILVDDVIAGFGALVRPLWELIAEEIEAPYWARAQQAIGAAPMRL